MLFDGSLIDVEEISFDAPLGNFEIAMGIGSTIRVGIKVRGVYRRLDKKCDDGTPVFICDMATSIDVLKPEGRNT